MSTYKKYNEDVDVSGFSNCPAFLERYLTYRQNFTNTKSGSLVDIFTVMREFCQYFHFRNKIHTEPSVKDAHKDMDISLMDIQELCEITQDDIERYLCFLEDKVRNSSRTIAKKLNFIKMFYLYLEKNVEDLGITLPHGNPARFLEVPQTAVVKPVFLSQSEIERLANGATGENTLRDKAIILLLATTGIQTAELINLNRGDIHLNELIIHSPKGRRKVFLTPYCVQVLEQYLQQTDEYRDPRYPLFLAAATGKRLTARTIQLRIEKAAGVAGLANKNVTARMLRNTAADMLFRAAGEDRQSDVRRYLGVQSDYSMRNILGSIDERTLINSQIGQIGQSKR